MIVIFFNELYWTVCFNTLVLIAAQSLLDANNPG